MIDLEIIRQADPRKESYKNTSVDGFTKMDFMIV